MTSHLDLCSGIGGFALAARWAGYTTIGFVEIDDWCRKVLAKNFPGVPQHDDLKTLSAGTVREWLRRSDDAGDVANGHISNGEARGADGLGATTSPEPSARAGELSLITGGYPCQPFSLAGKRMGAADDRHLWPFIAALVADLKPRRCLFENVYGHVSMGLDDVLADLESLGYACGAVVVPAAAVGAPHRRDRVWILAHAESGDGVDLRGIGRDENAPRPDLRNACDSGSGRNDVADAERGQGVDRHEPAMLRRRANQAEQAGLGGGGIITADAAARGIRRGRASGNERQPAFPRQDVPDSESHLRRTRGHERSIAPDGRGGRESGDGEVISGLGQSIDGLSRFLVGPGIMNPWAGDWEAGCPRTAEREPDRVNKLKALGNAIVPQVAYAILSIWDESEAAA